MIGCSVAGALVGVGVVVVVTLVPAVLDIGGGRGDDDVVDSGSAVGTSTVDAMSRTPDTAGQFPCAQSADLIAPDH